MAAADHLCPVKDFKFSNEKPIWLTNDLIAIMKETDRCLRQCSASKTEGDKVKMRKARHLANISVKMARGDYTMEQLNTHKTNSKEIMEKYC